MSRMIDDLSGKISTGLVRWRISWLSRWMGKAVKAKMSAWAFSRCSATLARGCGTCHDGRHGHGVRR